MTFTVSTDEVLGCIQCQFCATRVLFLAEHEAADFQALTDYDGWARWPAADTGPFDVCPDCRASMTEGTP